MQFNWVFMPTAHDKNLKVNLFLVKVIQTNWIYEMKFIFYLPPRVNGITYVSTHSKSKIPIFYDQ